MGSQRCAWKRPHFHRYAAIDDDGGDGDDEYDDDEPEAGHPMQRPADYYA